ncbi:MFS transporter, partial [Pantoea agglomerans]|nr:MFS transporter [Pantoea agglomerans]
LGLWDGFFGAIGVTALLAATPALVGRENLMKAGAITMLTVLTLLRLPRLAPPPQPREHPLKALASGVQFLFASPIVG